MCNCFTYRPELLRTTLSSTSLRKLKYFPFLSNSFEKWERAEQAERPPLLQKLHRASDSLWKMFCRVSTNAKNFSAQDGKSLVPAKSGAVSDEEIRRNPSKQTFQVQELETIFFLFRCHDRWQMIEFETDRKNGNWSNLKLIDIIYDQVFGEIKETHALNEINLPVYQFSLA